MDGNWLVLETSGRAAKLGFARGGAVTRAVALDDARRHARDLASTVDGFLKAEGLVPRDLTGIVVSRGPGSYTGLRVGLISAKALAYATGCALVAVDTFAAVAEQAPAEAPGVWVIADALQGQVYAQRFDRTATGWVPFAELRIVAVDECVPWLAGGAWVSGPGVKVYAERLPTDCPRVAEADREPRVESLFAVAPRVPPLTREEVFALEPLYLRGSSAEENAKSV
ncbi:tRNA (adenosine(37)-N6)-threonylcarbamoyltransferase complex dimerization subunit type 1 TsaB [Gemmata sp.]|uniref:tRNA (adenosine(37)-N6)-threonylcarbamoyltransferase complex dimerization subunit type 1 TsaB n=1 Tax=Gemmata sp. TaxID=1914242 RepID=UPI003F6EEDF8